MSARAQDALSRTADVKSLSVPGDCDPRHRCPVGANQIEKRGLRALRHTWHAGCSTARTCASTAGDSNTMSPNTIAPFAAAGTPVTLSSAGGVLRVALALLVVLAAVFAAGWMSRRLRGLGPVRGPSAGAPGPAATRTARARGVGARRCTTVVARSGTRLGQDAARARCPVRSRAPLRVRSTPLTEPSGLVQGDTVAEPRANECA